MIHSGEDLICVASIDVEAFDVLHLARATAGLEVTAPGVEGHHLLGGPVDVRECAWLKRPTSKQSLQTGLVANEQELSIGQAWQTAYGEDGVIDWDGTTKATRALIKSLECGVIHLFTQPSTAEAVFVGAAISRVARSR